MKTLTEYILVRIEPTLRSIELDGYDETIEDFKRQLYMVISDYNNIKQQPTVKSCEGCEWEKFLNDKEDTPCETCGNFSNYQARK